MRRRSRGGPTTAYLGLGSNVGDRLATLRSALAALDADEATEVVAVSAVYETDPVTPDDVPDVAQGLYLNLVARAATTRPPRDVLRLAHDVEAAHGRDRVAEVRYGPRTLDVDLLLYGRERIDEPGLVVPHPRLTQRAFVLVPLAEVVSPGERLPDGSSIASHLARLAPLTGVEFHVRLTEGPGTGGEPLRRRPPGPRGAPPRPGPDRGPGARP